MAVISREEEQRATSLAQEASALIQDGNVAGATVALRQASAIAPDIPAVKDGLSRLREEERESEHVRLLKRWVQGRKEEDAKKALQLLNGQQLASNDAADAFELLRDDVNEESEIADKITGALLTNVGARKRLAVHFARQPTWAFEQFWDRGEESFDGLVAVVLDQNAWETEALRSASQKDVFQLSLAKLMDVGVDYPQRAMKAISRLLAAHAARLHNVVDADGFDVIIESLDIRGPVALRSHATLAMAKLLEVSPEDGQRHLTKYVTTRVARQYAEGLIISFSAVAAVFPILPSVAAALFLFDGFVDNLVPLVQARSIGAKSQNLEQATLELLSAACIDKGCREAILKHCTAWVASIANENSDSKRGSLASLILVKIKDVDLPDENRKASDIDEAVLIDKFKGLVVRPDGHGKQDAVEGLAYSSLRPDTKEQLASDQPFLKSLIKLLEDSLSEKSTLYGGLTIFVNLTTYRPNMSEEQKRMSQLKAYANASNPVEKHPLDDDVHVSSRCKSVLDAGIVPFLVTCGRSASQTLLSLVLQILLSLSRGPNHRGVLAQQGAVKLLLHVSDPVSNGTAHPTTPELNPSFHTAAHVLARILISVNPTHIFSGAASLPQTSAIRPLLSLLADEHHHNSEHRDLLPVFESLLALTNLASTDDETRNAIIRLAWTQLEDILLSNNTLVQRATVELVCNLMASPHGVAKFADGSKRAGNRLHVLLALADVEDLPTRRAAGGALAMLTEWDAAVDAVIARDRGVRILLGLCQEEGEDMRHRGAVCLRNVVCAPGEVGERGRQKVEMDGGVAVLMHLLKLSKSPEVLAVGVEALKALV